MTELITGCIMNMVTHRRYRLYLVLLGSFSVLSTLTTYIRTNDVFIEAPYKHTIGVGIIFNLTAITITSTTKSIARDEAFTSGMLNREGWEATMATARIIRGRIFHRTIRLKYDIIRK